VPLLELLTAAPTSWVTATVAVYRLGGVPAGPPVLAAALRVPANATTKQGPPKAAHAPCATGSLEHSHRDSHWQSPSHGSHAEAHERLNAARPRSRSTCQRVKCRGYPAHRALVVAGVASIAHPQGVCTQYEASRVLEYAGYALHTILHGLAERAARGRASAGTQSAFHRPTGGGLPIKS
jgi:hypothetical protein